jgi:hypothetical protein
MHPKKRQIKNVTLASPRTLGVGGVVIPTVPMYAGYGYPGAMSFTQQTTNGEENGEAPETSAQEAAEGAAPTSGSGEAAGTSAGAAAAGGM